MMEIDETHETPVRDSGQGVIVKCLLRESEAREKAAENAILRQLLRLNMEIGSMCGMA